MAEILTTSLAVNAVEKRLDKLREDIAASINSHGLKASGRTAASLVVQTSGDSVTLYGRAFFPALETGSSLWSGKTGIKCSVEEFQTIIRQWVRDKGLNFGQAKAHDRAVKAIAWSIIKRGTKQKRSGTRLDIYTSLVDEAADDCADIVGGLVSAEVDNVIAKWR